MGSHAAGEAEALAGVGSTFKASEKTAVRCRAGLRHPGLLSPREASNGHQHSFWWHSTTESSPVERERPDNNPSIWYSNTITLRTWSGRAHKMDSQRFVEAPPRQSRVRLATYPGGARPLTDGAMRGIRGPASSTTRAWLEAPPASCR